MSVSTLINNRGWVFEGIHNAYTVALVVATRFYPSLPASTPASGRSTASTDATLLHSSPSGRSRFGPTPGGGFDKDDQGPYVAIYPGPANSLRHFRQITAEGPAVVPIAEFVRWSNSAAFPQVPTLAAFNVWRKMKHHPRFILTRERESWRLRPVREFDASRDRDRFMKDDGNAAQSGTNQIWPVYKGSSFDIWEPETGIYYDSVSASAIIPYLQQKRLRQRLTTSSAFAEQEKSIAQDPITLPALAPRITFRDVTNPTNTRTVISALIPGNRVIVHQAPYLLLIAGTAMDEAYVLGVLCSMPCDWQARRTVELHMTFEQIGLLTIPDPGPEHPVRVRAARISGRLAAVDERFAEWAAEVGVPVGSANDPDVKQALIHELDACVAHLYGLDEDDLAVIYQTFDHKDPQRYAERHAAVLEHFRRIV